MNEAEETKRPDLPPGGPRGRGRPAKPGALTPAERARRYRLNQKAAQVAIDKIRDAKTVTKNDATDSDIAALQKKLYQLQLKYDLEHLQAVNLANELAAMRQTSKASAPVTNPLAAIVKSLKKTVEEQQKVIGACSEEINNLRDALKASRK